MQTEKPTDCAFHPSFRRRARSLTSPLDFYSYRDQTPLFSRLASQTAALSVTEGALYTPPSPALSGSAPTPIRFRKLDKGEEEGLRAEVEKMARARLGGARRAAGGV